MFQRRWSQRVIATQALASLLESLAWALAHVADIATTLILEFVQRF